jgi:hypothetical protein
VVSVRTVWFGATFAVLWGCALEEPLPPPPPNNAPGFSSGSQTSAASDTAGSSEDDTGGDTGVSSDGPCDPLEAPQDECGPGLACDLSTLECVPEGAAALDESCDDHPDCEAGLACHEGSCVALCNPDSADAVDCPEGRVCTQASAPLPGACLVTCDLLLDDCPLDGQACKPGTGPGSSTVAVCVQNPGAGTEGDACVDDTECAPGYLCTDAAVHTLPCPNDATSCCAPVCDLVEFPCFGLEPICYPLGIEGQDTAGYCGA